METKSLVPCSHSPPARFFVSSSYSDLFQSGTEQTRKSRMQADALIVAPVRSAQGKRSVQSAIGEEAEISVPAA